MNEDTLILYYYGELSSVEREQVRNMLEADAELAERYAALRADLDGLVDEVVAPSHVVQRMHDSIDRAARPVLVAPEPRGRTFNPLSFAWGAAVTAVLAIGIGIGTRPGPDPVPAPGVRGDAFARGVQVYLQDARDGIAAMPTAGTAEDRVGLVLDIIEQNRLYERVAVQNDAQSLARVLRAFEPILLQLAADDIAPEDAAALRAQLEFELDVMLTKLQRDSSNETHTT